MDPVQLLVVAAIVVGVILFDRRMRLAGLGEPGSGEAWTALRLARLLVRSALVLAVVMVVGLAIQAMGIRVSFMGFGLDAQPGP